MQDKIKQQKYQRKLSLLFRQIKTLLKDWLSHIQPLFSPVGPYVIFPYSVSSSSYESVLLDMMQVIQKGGLPQVLALPKYIDDLPFECYYCKKRLECQKCQNIKQDSCETNLPSLLKHFETLKPGGLIVPCNNQNQDTYKYNLKGELE